MAIIWMDSRSEIPADDVSPAILIVCGSGFYNLLNRTSGLFITIKNAFSKFFGTDVLNGMPYQLYKIIVSRVFSRVIGNVSRLIDIGSDMSINIKHAFEVGIISSECAVFSIYALRKCLIQKVWEQEQHEVK